MIIIKLFTTSGEKYARKPFFRPFCSIPNDISATIAKQFKTVKQAHAWLARRGFIFASGYTSIGTKNFPGNFTGFELVDIFP